MMILMKGIRQQLRIYNWRIYELGYSLETFGEVDKIIASMNWSRDPSSKGKTDRYGKKYSWIAYFEFAGFIEDKGLLRSYDEPRILDADIDPSFPEQPNDFQFITEDILGERELTIEKWIEEGRSPDISQYLVVESINGEVGPWILLDGFINQSDYNIKRSCFIVSHGILFDRDNKDKFLSILQVHEDFKQVNSLTIPEDYYTYAGEIPWCDTFQYNNQEQVEIVITTKKVTMPGFVININGKQIKEEDKETEVPDEVEILPYYFPVRRNNWEDNRNIINPGRFVLIPSKEISEVLDLCSQPQTLDMYEKNGKRAAISIEWGDTFNNGHRLVFMRKDLLDYYLNKKGYDIVWLIQGEREFRNYKNEGLDEFAKKHKPYKSFQQIKQYN